MVNRHGIPPDVLLYGSDKRVLTGTLTCNPGLCKPAGKLHQHHARLPEGYHTRPYIKTNKFSLYEFFRKIPRHAPGTLQPALLTGTSTAMRPGQQTLPATQTFRQYETRFDHTSITCVSRHAFACLHNVRINALSVPQTLLPNKTSQHPSSDLNTGEREQPIPVTISTGPHSGDNKHCRSRNE